MVPKGPYYGIWGKIAYIAKQKQETEQKLYEERVLYSPSLGI